MTNPKLTTSVDASPVFNVNSGTDADLSVNNFSGFGELISVGVIPSVQHTFHCEYHDAEHFTKTEVNGGAITFSNSQVVATTSAVANCLAAYYGIKHIRYRAGQALVLRFTTLLEANGADGILEMIGVSANEDAWGIGYCNTQFGIIHGKASGARIAVASITQTAGTATVTTTANHGLTSGDMVSVRNTAQDGYIQVKRVTVTGLTTFTYTVETATVSPATAFSGKSIYCVKVDIQCYPISSAIDRLDGTGASGMTLDRTKGNVWELHVPYLGYGDITAFVMYQGHYHLFDIVEYANLNTVPSLSNPSLALTIYCENTTNNTARTVKCGSMFAGLSGTGTIDLGVRKSARNTKTGISTETSILSIRNNRTFQGRLNHGRLKIASISIATEGAGSNVVEIFARKNAVTGSPSWTEIEAGVSCASRDAAGTVNTAKIPYPQFTEARNSQQTFVVSDDNPMYLDPEETLTISALSASSVAVTVCVNFVELKE